MTRTLDGGLEFLPLGSSGDRTGVEDARAGARDSKHLIGVLDGGSEALHFGVVAAAEMSSVQKGVGVALRLDLEIIGVRPRR